MTESTAGTGFVQTQGTIKSAPIAFNWNSIVQPEENKMTEFELLEELAKELGLPEIEPDEVTAQLVADYTGCSWTKAAATLKAKLAAGELTARQVRTQNGKPATAYRKAA
jgi:hypothetical protein